MIRPARALLLVPMLACAGCVSMARAPEGANFGEAFAEATFEMGVSDSVGLGHATVQEYRIGDIDTFEDGRTVKIFTWAAKKPATLLLETGARVAVFARMNRLYGAPGITSSGEDWCINGSRFTPAPNTRYRVIQVGAALTGCELAITEYESGNVPADLEKVLFPVEVEAE